MKDIHLTEHFMLSEFERSATAKAKGIDNTIPDKLIGNLKNLCNHVLEPLRVYANKPIVISSGYRSTLLNKLVGGATNSQHLNGEAADIHLNSNEEGRQWFAWIMDNCTYDQLIMERSSPQSNRYWIHVSCKMDISKNRQEVKLLTKT